MTTQPDLRTLTHRHDLGEWLNARGLTGKGVEVGVLFGTYSEAILKTWQGHLHAVDPWANQPEEVYKDGANLLDMNAVFAQARNGIGRHERCTLHRMMSLNAVGRFEDGELAFVYLDGNHGLDAIRADIAAWWPKVRIGGLVCGHDFFTRYDKDTNSDALTAVMEVAEAIGVRVHTTWCCSWWFVKTAEADTAFRIACMTDKLPRPVYTENSRIQCVVVVPVAQFDWNLACKLLRWMAKLAGTNHPYPLVIWTTPALTEEQFLALGDAAEPISAEMEICPDLTVESYFGSPNRVFKGALDYCERVHPGKAMLWVEADAVPMSPDWVGRVMDEYRGPCGRPFMGDVQREGAIPHLTGVAVYHPNWRKLAPALAALPGPVVEMGWDSQTAHDVLPRSHYAKTIQQVWRPPLPITPAWAAKNIRPETALFHQCKDGSLIDVLCAQRGLPPIPLAPALCASTYDKDKAKFADIALTGTVLVQASRNAALFTRGKGAARAQGGCEIMVVSCKRDAELLAYCLASIKKYATGFAGVTLVVPAADAKFFQKFHDVKLTTFDERPGKGMLHHEIMICRADELCPHADQILCVDSDCSFWQPVTPADYVIDGRCRLVRERYEDVGARNPNRLIWQRCVEAAVGFKPEWEGMTSHPMCYPRALFGHARALVEAHTGHGFDNYVFGCENGFPQSFAEHPLLSAVGMRDFADKFHYINYDHAADAREFGIPAETQFQYLYVPGRNKLVEVWGHAGLARYKADLDKWATGVLPKYYLK